MYDEYTAHPAADLLPLLDSRQLKDLADDIAEYGLLEPIELLQGTKQILDGRNRYLACKMVNVEPRFIEREHAEPYHYVISKNVKRRHLSLPQQVEVAKRAMPALTEEAKARKEESDAQESERAKAKPRGEHGRFAEAEEPGEVPENLTSSTIEPEPAPAKPKRKRKEQRATDEAAEAVGMSGAQLRKALFVQEHAPELWADVEAKHKSLGAAYKEASDAEKSKKESKEAPPSGTRFKKTQSKSLFNTALRTLREVSNTRDWAVKELGKAGDDFGKVPEDFLPELSKRLSNHADAIEGVIDARENILEGNK